MLPLALLVQYTPTARDRIRYAATIHQSSGLNADKDEDRVDPIPG
ncbi:MAG: hypothetical protein ACHQ6U_00800 [Thermodesulfobacteriota bacterium]